MKNTMNVISAFVLFLAIILFSQTGCDKDEGNPTTSDQTASIQVNWTVNGGPASTICTPYDSVDITIGTTTTRFAATAGGGLLTVSSGGNYSFTSTLLSGGVTQLAQRTDNVAAVAGQTATIGIDFSVPGSASFTWVIDASSGEWTSTGIVTIYPILGGTELTPQTFSASALSGQVNGLQPNTYDFRLVLTTPDIPGFSITRYVRTISIVAVQVASVPAVTFSTDAIVRITYMCSGPGCGATGNLKLEVVDCSDGTVNQSINVAPLTLVAGSPHIAYYLTTLGSVCLSAYLDVDGSGTRSSGDIIMSIPSVQYTGVFGETVDVALSLDAIQP